MTVTRHGFGLEVSSLSPRTYPAQAQASSRGFCEMTHLAKDNNTWYARDCPKAEQKSYFELPLFIVYVTATDVDTSCPCGEMGAAACMAIPALAVL